MPTLYLMHHAKSDWHSAAQADFERPLNPRGCKDAVRMGQWLDAQGLRPQILLASPAQRARQTVLAVAETLGFKASEVDKWIERRSKEGRETRAMDIRELGM